jgi:hypothetical protein
MPHLAVLTSETRVPLLQLDFHEREFAFARIDDVVLNADRARVRLPRSQGRLDIPLRGLGQQLAGCEADDDVVVRVAVPTRLGTDGETPLRDNDAIGLLEPGGYGLGSSGGHETESLRQ